MNNSADSRGDELVDQDDEVRLFAGPGRESPGLPRPRAHLGSVGEQPGRRPTVFNSLAKSDIATISVNPPKIK